MSKQPSRKGKKAWRKNVDVDDVTSALEAKREKQILHGDDDEDFVIDTQGDASRVPNLKTKDILANRSRVPPVVARKVKHKVSKAHAKKLMALAGRLLTESKLKARVDRDGIVRAKNIDVWADEPQPEQPDIYTKTAFRAYTPATKAPATLAHEPIALHVATDETLVHAGKSYNPTLESWKNLIEIEFTSEQDLDLRRQAMEEHQKRIQHLIETLDGKDVESSDDDVPQEEEEEEVDEDFKLSLNKKTELKIKTKTKRNKEARHKERHELYAKLKEIKKQIHDLSRLEDIQQEVDEKVPKTRPAKKYVRHGKNEITFKPIEVKLSDELTNNLRSVKPEGNLFYEHMHKLQASGRVEARVPVNRKRRYARKFTEKWSYKDFK